MQHSTRTFQTHACLTDDVRDMITVIHRNEPFKNQPGRVLNSFPNIGKMPLEKLKVPLLHTWLTHNKCRLFADQNSMDGNTDEEDSDTSSSEDSDEELLQYMS